MSPSGSQVIKIKNICFPRPSLQGLAGTDFIEGKKIMIETGLGDLIQKELLRTVIKNPKYYDYECLLSGIISEGRLSNIRDTSIPLKERSFRLREYLLDSLIVLNKISPRLTDENLIHYAKLINKAGIDPNSNGFNSGLRFRSNFDFSPQVFFGIVSHEFEHLAILDNFSDVSPDIYEKKPLSIPEEFVCDVAALNSLCYFTQENPLQRNNYPDDYLEALQTVDPLLKIARKYGFSFDYHHVARGSLIDLIEQFESLGIKKNEFIPIFFRYAKEIYQDYRTGKCLRRWGIGFSDFLEDFSKKLETHFQVEIKIKQREAKITKEVIKQFKEEILATKELTEEQIENIKEELDDERPCVTAIPIISVRSTVQTAN